MTLVLRRATVVAVLLLAGVLAGGCSKKKTLLPVTNSPPIVRVSSAPIDTNATCTPDAARSCYSLTLSWVGYDPDGRVDHYLYAVDPGEDTTCHSPTDTCWVVTQENEKRLVFKSPSQSPYRDSLQILRGYHVFVIAAVDNEGAIGPRVFRAFFSFTKAPTIVNMVPRPVKSVRTLPPSIRITWSGTDEDGVFTTKPVRYKYLLLGPSNEKSVIPGGIDEILGTQGAALRRYYAPYFKASDGWKTVAGDSSFVQFTDLVPDATYLFTVVAFDEAGAYSPVFGFDTNILRFRVGFAAAFGPKLTVFNESFFYEFGASYNPENKVRIEVPADQPVSFYWFATPPQGADITGYRWMLDGDVFDQRPRRDEATDLSRWSSPAVSAYTATVGPFKGGSHFFYVDASDNTGLKSLATIEFFVVQPTFEKPLLIVDDLRLRPDQFRADGTLINPQTTWPGAAEMDTFMYALGDVPWEKYPNGTPSPRGILRGYKYDTLGTRKGIADLSFSLAKLGEYKHVIWLVDYASAGYGNAGNQTDPQTSLRYMSTTGHLNALGAYVRMGGEAWLVGGGGVYATLISYNDNANDKQGIYVYNSTNRPKIELGPGRFMYDVPKWQSVIRSAKSIALSASSPSIFRNLGRLVNNPGTYTNVPATFPTRAVGTDPLPPLRTTEQFYVSNFSAEFIAAPNRIQEAVLGDPIDFKIDAFNDASAPPIIARWVSSDTLNTRVGQDAVTSPGTTRAAGGALAIRTQGGGASAGDVVTHDFFPTPRDWSGLTQLRFNIKQDQPTSAVQWRVRVITDSSRVAPFDTSDHRPIRLSSASALIDVGATGTFVDAAISAAMLVPDPTSWTPPNLSHVRALQFELANGSAPGTTEFDNIEVATLPEGWALDTLLAGQFLSTGAPENPGGPPNNALMTIYHGHDFQRPFIFTGFAPWMFRRAECKQLFDFVLQNVWGMEKTVILPASRSSTPFLPAHQRTAPLPRGGAGAGLRGIVSPRPGAAGGAGVRSFTPDVPSRRNGTP